MEREQRLSSASARRHKRRSGLAPVILGGGLFAVLLATAVIVANQTDKSSPDKNNQTITKGEVEQTKPSTTETKPIVSQEIQTPTQPVAALNENTAVDPKIARREKIRGHLAAGEFGPAVDLAVAVVDITEKSLLLQKIADAQIKAGEFDAALATIRRMPRTRKRFTAQNSQAQQAASASGGQGADFTQLIALIKSVTGSTGDVDAWDPDTGGSIEEFLTGVRVDPNGLLSHLTRAELNGRLKSLGIRARKADLNEDMARTSSFRIVSLTRLEQEVRKRLAQGKPVVETMKNLAGLQKIEFVIVSEKDGEILIGGPAEGWEYNEQGLPVGKNNGRPTLQLDDFVTVFRTFSRSGQAQFNCLIVPRQEGLKNTRAIAEQSRKRGPLSAAGTRSFVRRLNKAMGTQDVRVNGIPDNSRVARVIVDADYRMKLIGIDKLDGGPGIPSYFDLLGKSSQKNAPSLDALRWWLTMKYDSILHSKERNVFQIKGSSVLCQGLNEKITPEGKRIHTGKADPNNLEFARLFTEQYHELSKRDLVFADLQNVFDLSLVAALIRHEGIDRNLKWDGGVFAARGDYRPASYEPVKTVMSVSNHRTYKGRNIVIQVAGGVRGDLMAVLRNQKLRSELPRLGSVLNSARAPKLPAGRWWWDVKK
jgi:hypothetical protein